MNYNTIARLTDEDRSKLREIDAQILELQKKRSKILRNKAVMFEEERDYLASKVPDQDFYVNGTSSLHRKVYMNPRYRGLWAGVRMASLHKVFHRDKVPDDATDEQIEKAKKEMINQIDWLDENVFKKGLLWC